MKTWVDKDGQRWVDYGEGKGPERAYHLGKWSELKKKMQEEGLIPKDDGEAGKEEK
jgi:hypothetical protein